MKLTPLQKRAERRSRNQTMVDMNLVSLIDVFTILIFFLLSNSGGIETLPSPNFNERPAGVEIDSVVVHCMSLPERNHGWWCHEP